MKRITVTIMGQKVEIDYQVHSECYVEWIVAPSNNPNDHLLDTLLRIHYTPFIEASLREHAHYYSYSERVGAFSDEYKPF